METLKIDDNSPRGQLYNSLVALLNQGTGLETFFGGMLVSLAKNQVPNDIDMISQTREDWNELQNDVYCILSKYSFQTMDIARYQDMLRIKKTAELEVLEIVGGLTGLVEFTEKMNQARKTPVDPEHLLTWEERDAARKRLTDPIYDEYPKLDGSAAERDAYASEKAQLTTAYSSEFSQWLYEQDLRDLTEQHMQKIKDLSLKYPNVGRIDRVLAELKAGKGTTSDLLAQNQERLQLISERVMSEMSSEMIARRFIIYGPLDKLPRYPNSIHDGTRLCDYSYYLSKLNLWKDEQPREPRRKFVVQFPDWCDPEYFEQKWNEWNARRPNVQCGSYYDQVVDWCSEEPVLVDENVLFNPAYRAWHGRKPVPPPTDPYSDSDSDSEDYVDYRTRLNEWLAEEPPKGVLTRISDKQLERENQEAYRQALKAWELKKPFNWHRTDPVKTAAHAQALELWQAEKPQHPGAPTQISDMDFLQAMQDQLDQKYELLMTEYRIRLQEWKEQKPQLLPNYEGRLNDEEYLQQKRQQWNDARRQFLQTPEGQAYGEKGYHIDLVLMPNLKTSTVLAQAGDLEKHWMFDFRCNTLAWNCGFLHSLIDEDPELALAEIRANLAVKVGIVHDHRRQKMIDKGFVVVE